MEFLKNNFILIVLIGLLTYSCNEQQKTSDNEQQKTSDFKTETEKWKKELLASGVVGNPCREDNDWQTWEEENPKAYFGLQEIQSSESDFNSDGIKDGLFYFSAENCVGGNGWGSDFGMLVYSSNGELLTNKNITQNIENGIKTKLGKIDFNDIYIAYKGLGKTIIGEYSAWSEEDASCCPSNKGIFEYDPTELTTKIKNRTE